METITCSEAEGDELVKTWRLITVSVRARSAAYPEPVGSYLYPSFPQNYFKQSNLLTQVKAADS
jgi:hypothetical protein